MNRFISTDKPPSGPLLQRPAPVVRLATFSLALVLLLALGLPLYASGRSKHHDRIGPQDYEKAVPLIEIVKIIKRDYDGRLLEIELENERLGGKNVLVYEAKVLLSRGDVLKLYYDARTATLLKLKGHYPKHKGKGRSFQNGEKRLRPSRKGWKHREKHDDDDEEEGDEKHGRTKYHKYQKYN